VAPHQFIFILAGKLIFFWKFLFVEPVQWQKNIQGL
jgi:hypothetical protein